MHLGLTKYRKEIKQVYSFSSMTSDLKSQIDWQDFVYRYFVDVDALKLYFIRVTPGLIQDTESMKPGLVIDYDQNGKIVVIEIKSASKVLACDLIDAPPSMEFNGKSPMLLRPRYYAKEDCFEVFFYFTRECSDS